jgi:hypothetical protein
MLWQMYGWWTLLIALPPAVALAVWVWLSPSAHHALDRADPRCVAEHRLAILRLQGRISAGEYQDAMADLARHPLLYPLPGRSRHTAQRVG